MFRSSFFLSLSPNSGVFLVATEFKRWLMRLRKKRALMISLLRKMMNDSLRKIAEWKSIEEKSNAHLRDLADWNSKLKKHDRDASKSSK
ncbi:unnamed protein product [Arabis nemorensis]|uniref:Uncharacterized protein n=1 Tax=Arabis nemorensis TaxID=586526 RepID=A0A565BG12_9BRAS|nr:unnamed protein product [Arabis nemorensis]